MYTIIINSHSQTHKHIYRMYCRPMLPCSWEKVMWKYNEGWRRYGLRNKVWKCVKVCVGARTCVCVWNVQTESRTEMESTSDSAVTFSNSPERRQFQFQPPVWKGDVSDVTARCSRFRLSLKLWTARRGEKPRGEECSDSRLNVRQKSNGAVAWNASRITEIYFTCSSGKDKRNLERKVTD